MRLVFFVNNSIKDFSSPTFIPEEGEKNFLLSRFTFAVILENYCHMKGIPNDGKSVYNFIHTDDFKNYALSFLADNFIYSASIGDSMDLIECSTKFHSMKADFDISSCCSIVSSSDLGFLIEQVYHMVDSIVNHTEKEVDKNE